MEASNEDQLERIRKKISLAGEKDTKREVFGSDVHQYTLHAPITEEKVLEFEKSNKIVLPKEYRTCITKLGNGGPGYYGGAGPNYGIYPLGNFGYMIHSAPYMTEACIMDSSTTDEKWQELTAFTTKFDDESLEYEQFYNRLFSGMMFIGTMGCSGQMMLILNGKDVGRVAYIDQDLNHPALVQEQFLDWYEKWLDEILNQP